MGLRKDLDLAGERYIYQILHNNKVIYVGTAKKPKQRFKTHIKRAKSGSSALVYKYIRAVKFNVQMKVVKKINGTYELAEKEEIKEIEKHSETVMNFYNNPNKSNYNKFKKLYSES